jgi:hypothetical protein
MSRVGGRNPVDFGQAHPTSAMTRDAQRALNGVTIALAVVFKVYLDDLVEGGVGGEAEGERTVCGEPARPAGDDSLDLGIRLSANQAHDVRAADSLQ